MFQNYGFMKKITLLFIFCFSLNSYCQTAGNGLTDIDGNTYNSVIIGTQEWMKENLNVSKYKNGDVIPKINFSSSWQTTTVGSWCNYYGGTLNPPDYGSIYGKLYNWFAIDDSRGLAPEGWHIPSYDEWMTLINFLGGSFNAGSKLKEVGNLHWASPNEDATNESGFNGLPGGNRDPNGLWYAMVGIGIPYSASWWGTSEINSGQSSVYSIKYNTKEVVAGYIDIHNSINRNAGLSVRCVKNSKLNNSNFENHSFKIYPIPATEQITIYCGNLTTISSWSFKIVNTLGQEIVNGILNSQLNVVPLNTLNGKGIYFIKIYDDSNNLMFAKKIIIQ